MIHQLITLIDHNRISMDRIDHNSDHNRTGTDRTREHKTENGRDIPGQKSAESGRKAVMYVL